MGIIKDLTGQKFARLLVLGRESDHILPTGRHQVRYLCRCDCGTMKIVKREALVSENTKSCGCLRKEQAGNLNKTHCQSKTKLYKVWKDMVKRCTNPHGKDLNNYMGKGIKVCDEWKNFEPFYNWAIINGYSEKLTIDRIDNIGNYEPSNCRWATVKEQQNNKGNNHLIEYKGRTQTMVQWCEELKLNYDMLRYRVNDLGWNSEKAFNAPNRYATNRNKSA